MCIGGRWTIWRRGLATAINRYATETGVHLVPYNETSTGAQPVPLKMWHHRLKGALSSIIPILGTR